MVARFRSDWNGRATWGRHVVAFHSLNRGMAQSDDQFGNQLTSAPNPRHQPRCESLLQALGQTNIDHPGAGVSE